MTGVLAFITFIWVPLLWSYLALTNQEIERHSIAPWTITIWPGLYALSGLFAVLDFISGKGLAQVWKPVLVLFVAAVVPASIYSYLSFLLAFFKDIGLGLLMALPLVLFFAYACSHWIVRRWFADQLRWQNTVVQRLMLASVTVPPPVMVIVASFMHGSALHPLA